MRQGNVRYALFGLAGVGLLLVGLVSGLLLGSAFAGRAAAAQAGVVTTNASAHDAAKTSADTPTDKYCQVYEDALAQQLKVDKSTLEAANVAAIQATLTRMATDGQITQIEETQLNALAQQLGTNPCTHLSQQSIMSALAGNSVIAGQVLAARGALLTATASALHIDSTALNADLMNGKTVADVASAHHVALQTVETAYLNAANTFLSKEVSNGTITAAQKDQLSAMLRQSVAKGHFLLLDGGMNGLAGGR